MDIHALASYILEEMFLHFNKILSFSAVDEEVPNIELILRTEDSPPISYNGKLPDFFHGSVSV